MPGLRSRSARPKLRRKSPPLQTTKPNTASGRDQQAAAFEKAVHRFIDGAVSSHRDDIEVAVPQRLAHQQGGLAAGLAEDDRHQGKNAFQRGAHFRPVAAGAAIGGGRIDDHERGHAAPAIRYQQTGFQISFAFFSSLQPRRPATEPAMVLRLPGGSNWPSDVRRITTSSSVSAISPRRKPAPRRVAAGPPAARIGDFRVSEQQRPDGRRT